MTDDIVEKAAREIYESIFADDWVGGNGIEAAQYRQAATAVLDALHVREMREALDVARRALVTVFCCDPKTSHAVLTIDAARALLNPQQEASDA